LLGLLGLLGLFGVFSLGLLHYECFGVARFCRVIKGC
jgi:hypothetical protein